MKQIRDAVHGYIQLNDLELELLDTKQMQRLRRVKQLGFTNLVYPSATHSRFEHSLGTFEVAKKFGRSLDLEEDELQELKIAGLLHDIGHPPVSHSIEPILEEHLGKDHEDITAEKIGDTEIEEILEAEGVSPDKVCNLIRGEGTLGGLISGKTDADRIDYLQRDAHYTGVAHGTIESDTIIRNVKLEGGEPVFTKKSLTSLESLLVARYLMIPTVYLHHTSEIAEYMVKEATRLSLGTDMEAEDLKEMDEWEFLYKLQDSEKEEVRELAKRIKGRELYKRALVVPPTELGKERYSKACKEIEGNVNQVKDEIRESADVKKNEVLLHIFDPGSSQEKGTKILYEGDVVRLKDLSPITKEVEKSLWNHAAIRVYAPEEKTGEVRKAAEDVLQPLTG